MKVLNDKLKTEMVFWSIIQNTPKSISHRTESFLFCIITSKDLQQVVFSEFQDGD